MKASEAFELSRRNADKAKEENQRLKAEIMERVKLDAEQGSFESHIFNIRLSITLKYELEREDYRFRDIRTDHSPYFCIYW